jgi:hypothetical protein
MNVTRSSPTLAGEFDEFLFAPVGEEANGMLLSVLSALSRLGIDPWADAARLAHLPKDSAIVALGQSIALLPLGKWQAADTTAIATRLIELLPRPGAVPAKTAPASAKMGMPSMPANWQRRATLVLALLSAGLAGYLLVGTLTRVEHRAADSGPAGIHVEADRTRSP